MNFYYFFKLVFEEIRWVNSRERRTKSVACETHPTTNEKPSQLNYKVRCGDNLNPNNTLVRIYLCVYVMYKSENTVIVLFWSVSLRSALYLAHVFFRAHFLCSLNVPKNKVPLRFFLFYLGEKNPSSYCGLCSVVW